MNLLNGLWVQFKVAHLEINALQVQHGIPGIGSKSNTKKTKLVKVSSLHAFFDNHSIVVIIIYRVGIPI